MQSYYKITEALKSESTRFGFKTVVFGDLSKVDLKRQSIFPLIHIVPDIVSITGKMTQYNFSIYGMDLVDFNKIDLNTVPETFEGTDNLQDVLNDILIRLSSVISQFTRGDQYDQLIRVTSTSSLTPFQERFENLLAGWELSITIETMTGDEIC